MFDLGSLADHLQRLPGLERDEQAADCACAVSVHEGRLVVDADRCEGRGVLATSPACRRTVVATLRDRDVDAVLTRHAGVERAYEDTAAAFLVAAGRFADAVAHHETGSTARACRDPLSVLAAAPADGRLAEAAATVGLDGYREADYDVVLRPFVGPTLARSRVAARPPPDATLRDRFELSTGAVVRLYDRADDPLATYHLEPVEHRLDPDATATLAAAFDRLARGDVGGDDRAPARAVRAVAAASDPIETLAAVLRKHTLGLGVLVDCFADDAVTDVFASAPVETTRLRVRRDGEAFRTNVRLTDAGARALASRFRRASGRPFSRAAPTLAASAHAGERRLRVAGVTTPLSDGVGFAFRAHDRDPRRLADLVATDTLPPPAAALLSLAVEHGAAVLVAGPRGAGKTTLLGALLWAVPPAVRTVVIEDTPELPVAALRAAGRDVQQLHVSTGDGESIPPAAALRTALRLGDGAIVVGEVRGEEARVLYEAMRVGAADGAVLGTIHGEGAATVRERVVSDLDVPESAFADTDLVVTLTATETATGRRRRLDRIEAVTRSESGVSFPVVYDRTATDPATVPAAADDWLAGATSLADPPRAIERRAAALGGE